MTKLGTLCSSAAAVTLVLGASTTMSIFVAPQPAHADDCLLDTTDNGLADDTLDTDGGAETFGVDARLACGVASTATGSFSTAVGGSATATGTDSTALGSSADATGSNSTAIGRNSSATVAKPAFMVAASAGPSRAL